MNQNKKIYNKTQTKKPNHMSNSRGVHGLGQFSLGQTWTIKLDLINKWIELKFSSRKPEVKLDPTWSCLKWADWGLICLSLA